MNVNEEPKSKEELVPDSEHLKRGRESAKIEPKSASDHVADAQATRYSNYGTTLGK